MGIRVYFGDKVGEVTEENAFAFFNYLFPYGIILKDVDGMLGLSIPQREDEDDGQGE